MCILPPPPPPPQKKKGPLHQHSGKKANYIVKCNFKGSHTAKNVRNQGTGGTIGLL